jgi:hypothetical protein
MQVPLCESNFTYLPFWIHMQLTCHNIRHVISSLINQVTYHLGHWRVRIAEGNLVLQAFLLKLYCYKFQMLNGAIF